MRNVAIATLTLLTATTAFAQQTTESWENQGETREYIQYVPSAYNGSESVPLVIAIHGLGDNMNNFVGIGMNAVADTANFIVVYPQALKAFNPMLEPFFGPDSITAWNSGAGAFGFTLAPPVSDVDFINALIDTVSAHYNIDQNRVFATGFSMGGFLSNRLACELPRIAAIASVGGTLGSLLDCQPGRSVPACHFHGTADTQVGYGTPEGEMDNLMGLNVNDWVDFWADNNGCGEVALAGALPDIADDGFTVEYLEYNNCNDNSRVARYKVNGAEHIWLGPANDIFYTVEIWKFFSGSSPTSVSIGEQLLADGLTMYPNPVQDRLFLTPPVDDAISVRVIGLDGRMVAELSPSHAVDAVDVSLLEAGSYVLLVQTSRGAIVRRFVKVN